MTMGDIIREVEEDLRRDRYEHLARTYGPYVLVLAVMIIAGTGAYAGWRNWRDSRNQQQTEQLVKAMMTPRSGSNDAALDALVAVARDSDPSKAAIARLVEAGLRVNGIGDREPALAAYQALGTGGDAPMFRDLARLLDAMQRLNDGDPNQLNAALAPLTAADQPWRSTALELTALLALRTGEPARAADIYQQLAANAETPAALRRRAGELAVLYGAPAGDPSSSTNTPGEPLDARSH